MSNAWYETSTYFIIRKIQKLEEIENTQKFLHMFCFLHHLFRHKTFHKIVNTLLL